MSEQPAQSRICPTCGNTVPSVARYCPNCGTRLDPLAAYTADDFEDALADVLTESDEQGDVTPPTFAPSSPDAPTASFPPITATPPSEQAEWTASASDWSQPTPQPGTWGPQPPIATTPAKQGGNRTLWIILAIFGFIVFCCCGAFAVLMVIGSTDTAFQEEMSRYALLRLG